MVSKNKTTIGVFGGSFSPVHLGHQQVTRAVLEQGIVEQIWLLPCKKHTFGKTMQDTSERLRCLNKLIIGLPKEMRTKVRIEKWELEQEALSISYQTLLALKRRQPEFAYKFIIGSDQVQDFPLWHDYQKLLREFEVLVYPRVPDLQPKLLPGMIFLQDLPTVNISSTQIRQLQAAGDESWRQLAII
ncbi:MAG: nicotinate-nicotinamide nucleotide adenylyltransferase [bacterium]|nr:nicotinate-nicotinamide nucleotide adenylyltransferase [bacterium]